MAYVHDTNIRSIYRFLEMCPCKEFCVKSPWVIGIGCKTIQKFIVCDHEKGIDHNIAIV
jgi:hypothetical protein